jgi:transposase
MINYVNYTFLFIIFKINYKLYKKIKYKKIKYKKIKYKKIKYKKIKNKIKNKIKIFYNFILAIFTCIPISKKIF